MFMTLVRRWRSVLTSLILAGLVVPAWGQETKQPAEPKPQTQKAEEEMAKDMPRVELQIAQGDEDWGTIVIALDEAKAPGTVKNFLQYVDEGFYDGTIFHRVMSNFMIQGGGFVSLTEQKREGLHEPIQNEANNGLKNTRGTIAMARTRAPHSATAQFFINVVDNPSLDYPSRDGWGYCVFGHVVSGMDVVDRIRDVEVAANPMNPREKSQPVNPPVIKKARRLTEE
jgi:peptidyl-prolyl cis-trans isomerase B (cyclophilin B)